MLLYNAAPHSAASYEKLLTALCRDMDITVNIVQRKDWGASPARKKENIKGYAERVVIHHTAMPCCKNLTECKQRLVNIQREHQTKRSFDDIGYNFLVWRDGTVFEGRGWGLVGAHSKGNNHDSLGVAFMGNFNDETPSTEALSSVKQLLQTGVSLGFLQPGFGIFGHRDLGKTECPGENLFALLSHLRSAK